MKKFTMLFALLIITTCAFAQRGKQGDKTVTATQTIVNEYTGLTADATIGQTSITVTSNNLNANNRFPSPLAKGDLVLVIQVQGASILSADASSYGTINSYNNCGNHEFLEVWSVSGTQQITFTCPLANDYTALGKTQIVRVPRYNTLTVNASADITCPVWNGATGGIVAIETLGSVTINTSGKITATGKGFRGGKSDENDATYGVTGYVSALTSYGAEKGEGIAGSVTDYDALTGRYSMGAAANGGGGGNGHNGGGGGGGNGGDITQWTGKGLPDNGTNGTYIPAWELEQVGFSTATSHGGGQGGYTFSANDQNALTTPLYTSAWGGDWRDPVGGRGGRPLDYTTGRLFMGGAGGAGDQNDNTAGDGGNGGGIVYIVSYGPVTGGGTVESNGANGQNSGGGFTAGTDGGGGGGAGGTIFINTTNLLSNLTLIANGGTGGNQQKLFGVDAYGPGGGGGGGYIAATGTSVTRQTNGGANGISTSPAMIEFPPNGATRGFAGVSAAQLDLYDLTATSDTVCNGSEAILNGFVAGTLPLGYQLEWYDTTGGTINVLGTGNILQHVFAGPQTVFLHTCPGSFSLPVVLIAGLAPQGFFTYTDVGGFNAHFFNQSVNGTSYSWNFGDNGTSTEAEPVHHYPSEGMYTVTLIVTNNCGSDTVTQSVTIIKVGVAEELALKVKIYPNPANDVVMVNTGDVKGLRLELMDISGRVVFKQNLFNSTETIDVSSLVNGVYVCSLYQGTQPVKRDKLIVAR